ncbi:MAG: diguanylate cyclase [Pirellulaceae bacterium]
MLRTFPRKLAGWIGWNWSGDARRGWATTVLRRAPLSERDLGTAVELFSRLAEITSNVAHEVRQHSGSIDTINSELSVLPPGDVAAVVAAVGKLLVMNQQTQQRLTQAELRLQAQQRQLSEVSVMSKTDALTGLMNRRALDEQLRLAIADSQRIGRPATLLLLDLDHFKRFNDSHGHLAGDQALRVLADVLLAHSRESDIVARFGGEEFVVLFGGAHAATVLHRAENMRAAIRRAGILYDGRSLHIAASVGLTELQADDDSESLLKRADEALYAAKLDGRDCAYWHEGDRLQRIDAHGQLPLRPSLAAPEPELPGSESAALAPDQFADATFVAQIARRVAEWRRGGTTFSLVLAQVEIPTEGDAPAPAEACRTALRIVHQSARASLRDMDLLTRWKDDGLAILLPGSLVTDAAGVAGRLRNAMQRFEMPAPYAGMKLSLCAGVAEVIEGNDAQRVLRRAWLALDGAKAAGCGQVFLHDGLRPVAASNGASASRA